LVFEGNRVISQQELLSETCKCLAADSASEYRFLDYCLSRLKFFLTSKGYLQANVGEPKKQNADKALHLIVPINEGPLFKLGKIEIKGSTLFSSAQMLELLDLKPGDIANADCIGVWAVQKLGRVYANLGYIDYTANLEFIFHVEPGAREGTADLRVTVEEGAAFTVRSIKFEGNANISESDLLKEMFVSRGEIFNRQLFEDSLKRISQTGHFERIDADRDVDYKSDNEKPFLDITIHLKRKAS
jgi:outer membrane protein insertion porin family